MDGLVHVRKKNDENYPGKRPQIVRVSGRIMYENEKD